MRLSISNIDIKRGGILVKLSVYYITLITNCESQMG
jgi:hypothetical protein